MQLLKGKKGLVIGIANANSIAYGCAKELHQAGAELVLGYATAKSEPYIQPLLPDLGNPDLLLCDVRDEEQLKSLFQHVKNKWGKIDFLVHSIAYCPQDDLSGRVTDCSREGFQIAMDVSCYSFIRMAHLAEPLMKDGGTLLTMSYYGAEKVVPNYNIMGPVKAALECSVRYLANELGPKGIRVHALSPGPIRTRAAGGIDHFESLLNDSTAHAPAHQQVTIEDVGAVATCLISDAARTLTEHTAYVDAGHHILG